jgi:hypothetical protein
VSPINRSFVRSFVSNVVVWKTILYDPAAKLFAVRFWEVITARSPNDNDSLSTAVRAAFEAAKVAVQCADGGQTRRGHIDVGGGKTCAAAVPRAYELHDPEFGLAHAPSTRYGEA